MLLTQLTEVEGEGIQQIRDFTVNRFPLQAQAMYNKPEQERDSYEHQVAYMIERQVFDEGLKGNSLLDKIGKERFAKREQILKQLQRLDANPYAPAQWMTVIDASGPIRPTRIPGQRSQITLEPALPEVFGGQQFQSKPPIDAPTSSGRRTGLADWITSPENPIAARVLVNRLWQYHFDTGLVSSPNDFGRLARYRRIRGCWITWQCGWLTRSGISKRYNAKS